MTAAPRAPNPGRAGSRNVLTRSEAGRAHDLARSLRAELDVHKATAVAHIERARGHIEASKGIATARNLGARERQLERQAGKRGSV